MKNRKWLILILVVITMMSLATRTGATRGSFIDNRESTDDALGLRWGLVTLDDSFEGTPRDTSWDGNGTTSLDGDGTTSWDRRDDQAHTGSYGAGRDKDNTPDDLGTSSLINATSYLWMYTEGLAATELPPITEATNLLTFLESGAESATDDGLKEQVDAAQPPEIPPLETEPPSLVTMPAVDVATWQIMERETKQDVAPAVSTIVAAGTRATDDKTTMQVAMAEASLERQVKQAADPTVAPDVRVLREDVRDIATARAATVGKAGRVWESAALNFQRTRLNAAKRMTDRATITLHDALYKLGAPIPKYRLSTWVPPSKRL